MMKQFEGKVALVTGAASGIGEATALMFADRGASLMLFDLDGERAGALADSLRARGIAAESLAGDVADSAACTAAVEQAVARFGQLDVLVNNAGGGKLVAATDLSDADWRHMQAINVDGTFYMSRAALRPMLAAGRGAIVNVASVHGLVGFACHVGYTAAKAAIVNMTRTLGSEYSARGVRVNAVCPGVILTPLIERTVDAEAMKMFIGLHPIGRLGRAEEVARTICFLASDEASFVTGASLAVDGGYTAV